MYPRPSPNSARTTTHLCHLFRVEQVEVVLQGPQQAQQQRLVPASKARGRGQQPASQQQQLRGGRQVCRSDGPVCRDV